MLAQHERREIADHARLLHVVHGALRDGLEREAVTCRVHNVVQLALGRRLLEEVDHVGLERCLLCQVDRVALHSAFLGGVALLELGDGVLDAVGVGRGDDDLGRAVLEQSFRNLCEEMSDRNRTRHTAGRHTP